MLGDYRAGRTPLSAPVAVLRAWIARFGEPYLAQQMFFSPYPEEVVSTHERSRCGSDAISRPKQRSLEIAADTAEWRR